MNLFPDCVKLLVCLASATTEVSSNPCVGPSPRTKISFFYFQHPQMRSHQRQK